MESSNTTRHDPALGSLPLVSACLAYLADAQNQDGGWGFSKGLESRVEPTSWGLLALSAVSSGPIGGDSMARGYDFIERTQLADGSWPASPGQGIGSWVTSLACWALLARDDGSPKLAAGIRWLNEDTPGDARFLRRFVRRLLALRSNKRVNAQSEAYWGWSWTEGTASWVEPTAQALIVLRIARAQSEPDSRHRQMLAEKMLYDRMCPGGGWNCGNPMVYGVPGEPLTGPTVWALLALRPNPDRRENQLSLDWLAQNWMKIQSPGSLALADIALQAYGKQIPETRAALAALYAKGDFTWTVPVAAWTALAFSGKTSWLNVAPQKTIAV